jgi:VanZ family protein
MPTFPLRHKKLVLNIGAAVSVFMMCMATLWPLNPWPKNELSWLEYEDGVRLCKHGTILSMGQFGNEADAEIKPFSLEVWMEPWRDEGSTVILAFYERENPDQFILGQDGLAVSVLHTTGKSGVENPKPLVSWIPRGKTLVTVTASPNGTTLYLNGKAQGFSRSIGLSRRNITGELVIGTSPIANKCWCGVLRGVAIYGNDLTAQEVSNHYKAWSLNHEEVIPIRQPMLALYLFHERSGSLVRNEIQPGVNLSIPKYYTLWRHSFLLPPWKEFQPNWTYVSDLFWNVLGFVPLGLILYPYFLVAVGSKRPWLMSCVAGAALSLLIEILQSFLPQRSSGWTDVITNSAGTALGASICFSSAGQAILKKLFGEQL